MALRVRSIFLSDVHLGTRACQAERLLAFLKAYDSQYLYLVGDIIDFWAMKSRGVYWSEAQNTVVQKILKRASTSAPPSATSGSSATSCTPPATAAATS